MSNLKDRVSVLESVVASLASRNDPIVGACAMRNLNFGEALRRLKLGKRVARAGWNGRGMFLFLVKTLVDGQSVGLADTVVMRTAQGTNVAWTASQTDLLAADWYEVAR